MTTKKQVATSHALALRAPTPELGFRGDLTDFFGNDKTSLTNAPRSVSAALAAALTNDSPIEFAGTYYSPDTILLQQRLSNLKNSISPASIPAVYESKSIEEKLFDATSTVKIITSEVAMHLDVEQRDNLFRQIDSMHDINEWDPDDKPIQKQSFITYIKTILFLKTKRQPSLGLSYNGNLLAAWIRNPNQLYIEFQAGDKIKWSLVKDFNGQLDSASGQTTVSRLLACLAPYEPSTWLE